MESTWEIIDEERGKARKGIDIQSLIIDEERGKARKGIDIQSLIIDNNEITNQKQIANILNNYFLTIADTISSNNNNHRNTNMTHPINYLANSFRIPFANIH
jgi:hypothetical protein